MFYWKKSGLDIIEQMKEKGYNAGRIRREKLLGENALQSLRDNKVVGINALDSICRLTGKQPGQLIAWKPDPIPAADQEAE